MPMEFKNNTWRHNYRNSSDHPRQFYVKLDFKCKENVSRAEMDIWFNIKRAWHLNASQF